jgi:hypothetical protein
MPLRRRIVPPLAAVVAAATLAGCITGERPILEETAAAAATGDAPVDAVLSRLDVVGEREFTATYDITNNFGPLTRTATVSQLGDGRRSVTIGDVRFLLGGSTNITCRLGGDGEQCSENIDDAAISDLQVTHQFYARSAADRLRTDAARRVGTTEGYASEIGGQPATCVAVPVSGGTKVWCALDSGPLASYQGPDVVITLTSFAPAGDEAQFSRTG